MGDIARVLKGASLVIDHAVRRNGPEIKWRLERLAFNLSEILKQAQDYQSQQKSEASNSQNSRETNNNESVTPKSVDVIGFESVNPATDLPSEPVTNDHMTKMMRERAVPSSQIGRFMGFGSLAVRMAVGEMIDRTTHVLSGETGPKTISDDNAERLAEALCRMRGAALKLGQMLSLQDESSLPPSLARALERVKHAADYMPKRQLEQQLISQLGEDWRSKIADFNYIPIAAASIGQVHKAILHDGTEVAMKIQYPGVAESIESDLQNLKAIVNVANFLPPGLFIDNIIKVASKELVEECDYKLEAASQIRYRELVMQDPVLSKHTNVPETFVDLSTNRILTSKLVPGVSIDQAVQYPQNVKNAIARTFLVLTIRELFEWRFIQSDPNFANFLYDHPNKMIHLIDFGAARSYSKTFVDGYMKLVWAAANKDIDTILQVSKDLGFITGDESQEFIDAHIEAGLVVGDPFVKGESFDFGNAQMTTRINKHTGTFLKHRLTPPPTEVYSLHRKLAGAFFLAIRLKANIPCRDILEDAFNKYKFN